MCQKWTYNRFDIEKFEILNMQLYFGDKSNVESSKSRLTKWILPISDISYSNSVKKREEIMFRVIPKLAVYLIFIHSFLSVP